MAYFIGPQLNQQYKDYLLRVIADGGFYSRPSPNDFQSDVDTILPLNPSLYTPANAGKVSKMYSMVPDTGAGDFTVSRNGTATYLDKDGLLKTAAANEPRFEFNTDGSFRGVLVEPAATNIQTRSEDIGVSPWNMTRVTRTANVTETLDPAGGNTADKIIPTTENNSHFTTRSTETQNGQYTVSVFAKAAGYNFIELVDLSGSGRYRVRFDLSAGTITNLSAGGVGAVPSILNYGNGWYRCIVAYNVTSQGVANGIVPRPTTATGNFAGDGVSGAYLWGAQLETGSVATSYIPTVASTVTKPADVISLTGASALIGQTEGTIYIEGNITNYVDAAASFITISDNTINNRIEIRKGSPNQIILERNSSTQSGTTSITLSGQSNGIFKMAVAYQSGNTAFYVNGVQVGANNTATFTMSLLTHIYLGNNATGSTRRLNDSIKAASIFPTRLSNAQLQSLTTL